VKESHSYSIIFAGTPSFAVNTLAALLNSRHTVKAVYTQPDRPAGRGQKLTKSPVKELALQHSLPIYQPITLRDPHEQAVLAGFAADILVVVAYGLILPLPILKTPTFGCINVHASLLPRWRGAAPIQRAILAGDSSTGVTIMQMDEGLDTGDMLYKLECPIHLNDTAETLHDRLCVLGAKALLKTLDSLTEIKPEKQNTSLATYAAKISKEEAELDWNTQAAELHRKICAFNPKPVAWSGVLRVWEAVVLDERCVAKPGMIIRASAEGIDVATREGVLRVQKIQLPGARALPVSDVLNARQKDFQVGRMFGLCT